MPVLICCGAAATSSEAGAAAGVTEGAANETKFGAGTVLEEDAPGVDGGSIAVASAVGDEVGSFAPAFAFAVFLGLALVFTSAGSGCAMSITT